MLQTTDPVAPRFPAPQENPLAHFTPPSPTSDQTTRRISRLVNLLDDHIRHGEPGAPGEPLPSRAAKTAVDDLNAAADALRPRIEELHALGLPVQPTQARWSPSLVSRLRAQRIQVCREARAEGDTARACLRLAALALEVVRRGRGLPAGTLADAELRPLVGDAGDLLLEMDTVRDLGGQHEPAPEPDADELTALQARTLSALGISPDSDEASALAAACLEQALIAPDASGAPIADRARQGSSWAIASAIRLLGAAEAHVRVHDPVLSLQKRRPVAQRIRREIDVLNRLFLHP